MWGAQTHVVKNLPEQHLAFGCFERYIRLLLSKIRQRNLDLVAKVHKWHCLSKHSCMSFSAWLAKAVSIVGVILQKFVVPNHCEHFCKKQKLTRTATHQTNKCYCSEANEAKKQHTKQVNTTPAKRLSPHMDSASEKKCLVEVNRQQLHIAITKHSHWSKRLVRF